VNRGQCGSKKDNQWTSTFRSHWGAILFKDSQDLVNSSSKWECCCTWRTYLSGFNLLNMVIDRYGHTTECKWMLKRCTQSGLTVRPSVLKIKGALYRMNMGDKMNIIDDANTFLFTIWFDELRRTMKKNNKLTMMSLLLQSIRSMSGWLGSSMKDGDHIYLNGMFQRRQGHDWLTILMSAGRIHTANQRTILEWIQEMNDLLSSFMMN
jgi:hypothetical protein